MASTSSALKKVVSEKLYDMAVICSEEAAKAFRMSVLAKNIEDYKSNSTRFLIVGKKGLPVKSGKKYKTSIAFYFSADAPGTLYQVLAEFNEAEVNMTRVESSANPSIPGGYVFYVDFEGHSQDIKIKKMLSCVRKLVKGMKLFGSY